MSDLRKDQSLYHALEAYSARDIAPMHMPGHKRRSLFAKDLPWHLDVTEIADFDNLHAPEGLLRDAQARGAALWGSEHAFFLINGSTAGILAGIYACTQPGDHILIGRSCHKSVYHAVELLRLRPVYLEPNLVAETELAGSIPPEFVAAALNAHPGIRLAVITSPTYEGILSDVSAIATLLHGRGIPLLVDEAHGAHLGISPHFPPGAVSMGADIVVQSLHKTLPSLTQTAMLHLQGGLVSAERVWHALAVFQSSSPSYPLLASIDACVAELLERGDVLLCAWRERLDQFYQSLDLQHLSLLTQEQDPSRIFAHDPGKLTILCGGTTQTGTALMRTLREDFHIELEMALDGYALAMTGLNSTDADLNRLREALQEIDRAVCSAVPRPPLSLPPMPEQGMFAGEALCAPGLQMTFSESVGRIAKSYIWVYPPGIPLVTPGVRVTGEIAACLAECVARGVELKHTLPMPPGMMEVVDKC